MVKASKASSKEISCTKASSSSSSSSTRTTSSGGNQKILDVCLFLEQKSGNVDVPRTKVPTIAGIKSSTLGVALCNMRKAGLIDYTPEYIRLTANGRARAKTGVIFSTDNKATQGQTMKRLKIGENTKSRILIDILLDGKTHDRATVMERVGMKSKGSEYVLLSNLKKVGAIIYDKSTITASDDWFPYGRDTNGETSD